MQALNLSNIFVIVYLENNFIRDKEIISLADNFKFMPKLQILDLGNPLSYLHFIDSNGFGTNGFQVFMANIKFIPQLQGISIGKSKCIHHFSLSIYNIYIIYIYIYIYI